MLWNKLVGQQRIQAALQRLITQQRIPHALLFHGPDGVGKKMAALAFAQSLQCEAGTPTACGTCAPCTKVARMIHPDVQVLFPYPGEANQDDIRSRLQRLAEDPYLPIDYVRFASEKSGGKTTSKQAIYTVARINEELRRTMSFKPVEGQYKIAILLDVERFRLEAANAFLKLLEEPGPRTVFMLLTDRPDKLLPTIISRCQLFRFDPLSPEDITRALRQTEEMDASRAEMLARMASGSYVRAISLASNEELMANRQLVVDFFRLAFSMNIDKLSDVIEALRALGRDQLIAILELMLGFVRDLLIVRASPDSDHLLINQDQRDTLKKFCENLPEADLESMVELVEEAIILIGRNVHIPLTLTVLAQQLRRAMKGQAAGKLFVPLVEEMEVAI